MDFSASEDVVHDVAEWAGGVDGYSLRHSFSSGMHAKYELLLLVVPAPVIGIASLESPFECLGVHVQYEDLVEHVDESVEVPRAAAEEDHLVRGVRDHLSDPVDIPYVVPETRHLHTLPRFGLAWIGDLVIPVDGLVATPAKFPAHRALAGARTALYEEVPSRHQRIVPKAAAFMTEVEKLLPGPAASEADAP